MHPNPGRVWPCVLIALAACMSRLTAATVQPDQPVTVIAVQVRGSVVVQHGEALETDKVVDGTQLGKADIITTAAQSSVMLVIPNGTVVALKEKSRLKISVALQSALQGDEPVIATAAGAEPAEPGVSSTSFELSFGEMLTRVRKLNPSSTFEVQTPVSVAAVRGTVFEISYQPGAKGDAQYQLSTASGLVQVKPHTGQMVAVSANQQMNLRAEIGKNGVKIKQVKSGKLDRRKGERIQKEGLDNERNAGELIRRVQPAGPNPQAAPAAGTPGANAQGTATNKANPAAVQPGNRDNSAGQAGMTPPPANAPKPPAANAPKPPTVTPPAGRAGPPQVTKPTVPAAKPKVPARPPAIKRPPRPPGT